VQYVHNARYADGMTTPGGEVADALGRLLQRGTRARLYGRLTAGLDEALDEATYPVISGLARTGSRSAAQLAADVGLDRSVVSRHATRLERSGLIERRPDPADQRATLLSLTGYGRQAVQEMRQRLAAVFDEYLDDWPAPEATLFATLLRRFTEDGPF
jgi:DNA-binding MarR family transcriptional regulator